MSERTASRRRIPTSQILFGAAIILIGILLLLDTTGTIETRDLLRYAPSLLILIGVWSLVRSRFLNVVGPVVLIGVGAAWQAIALGYATWEDVVVFWPILIIAFGLSVLLGHLRSRGRATEDDQFSAFAVFGGVERRNTSKHFTGADLTALFGGAELDIRDAEITDLPARINVVAMFGGVDIIAPREWNVRLDVIPILGGASDDRLRSESTNEEVDLVVTGFVAFGGVSISD